MSNLNLLFFSLKPFPVCCPSSLSLFPAAPSGPGRSQFSHPAPSPAQTQGCFSPAIYFFPCVDVWFLVGITMPEYWHPFCLSEQGLHFPFISHPAPCPESLSPRKTSEGRNCRTPELQGSGGALAKLGVPALRSCRAPSPPCSINVGLPRLAFTFTTSGISTFWKRGGF